jgi:hypothetical protein
LTGRHSKWIYVLLKAFVGLRERRISVNDLYYCLGIKQDTLFGNFKPHLDKAIDQINQFSDIKCNYELIKTGRKVTDIHFKIRKKTVKQRIVKDYRDQYPDLTKTIRSFFEDRNIFRSQENSENIYRKGAIKVHDFWEDNYKGRDLNNVPSGRYVSRSARAFFNVLVRPWLITEYKKKGGKIKPTWLASKHFESSLKSFIKDEFDDNKVYDEGVIVQ